MKLILKMKKKLENIMKKEFKIKYFFYFTMISIIKFNLNQMQCIGKIVDIVEVKIALNVLLLIQMILMKQ